MREFFESSVDVRFREKHDAWLIGSPKGPVSLASLENLEWLRGGAENRRKSRVSGTEFT
jgi:hypothetical protein